jgi:hypothetical protein
VETYYENETTDQITPRRPSREFHRSALRAYTQMSNQPKEQNSHQIKPVKTHAPSNPALLPRLLFTFFLSAAAALWAMPATALADIFETNQGANTVGEYTTSGTTVNAALISGLDRPTGLATDGTNLFVANKSNGAAGTGTIGKYATSGATVNRSETRPSSRTRRSHPFFP